MEKGYVYILTNPSFREDWVKIGRSSRKVDIRSKELDNTAVPLPFEIYATVQTSKFEEIEAKLHKILTELADLRIRKNREFFNIKPEEAFSYLKDLAELTNDAIINSPEDEISDENNNEKRKTYKGKYTVSFQGPYYMKTGLTNAKMLVQDGKYIVLEGSKIDPNYYSHEESIRKKRNELKDSLSRDGEIVVENILFDSPSMAAEFVRGGSSNGKYYWRTEDDRPLNDFIIYR